MKHSASDVARWFLWRNDAEMRTGDSEYISNLKLQKLLYYAQGIYLALSGKKLFSDNLVAWAHGPVVVDVYHEYCSNGSRGIEYNESLRPKEKYSKEERNVLEQVYNYFGQYSAWKLRNMTHEERPWLETPQNHVISPKLIKQYFLEEYVRESA